MEIRQKTRFTKLLDNMTLPQKGMLVNLLTNTTSNTSCNVTNMPSGVNAVYFDTGKDLITGVLCNVTNDCVLIGFTKDNNVTLYEITNGNTNIVKETFDKEEILRTSKDFVGSLVNFGEISENGVYELELDGKLEEGKIYVVRYYNDTNEFTYCNLISPVKVEGTYHARLSFYINELEENRYIDISNTGVDGAMVVFEGNGDGASDETNNTIEIYEY